MEEGIKNKIETMEIFKETADFFQFILKYKNCFSKKKYFTVDKNFKIIRKEPSFILELANIYYNVTPYICAIIIYLVLSFAVDRLFKSIEKINKIRI